MVKVTLVDETTYNIDTDSTFTARSVVEYKLRDRHDFRQIQSTELFEGCYIKPGTKFYNSEDAYDGEELKCSSGWAYKWGY